MKKVTSLLLLVSICVIVEAQTRYINIVQWRDHLSYYFTLNVCQIKDRILVAGQSALFYYNPTTKQMDKFNKVNGLSDAGIGVVAYDSVSESLVITYENSNIDIVKEEKVYNIPDIKDRAIEGSKAINSIYFADDRAYLSCGFGVVVLDLQRHEIYDTWYLGENSSAINVNCIYIDDTAIYAGTTEGLLYADKDSKTLASSQSWKNKHLTEDNNKEIKHILPYGANSILLNVMKYNQTVSNLIKYDGQTKDTVFYDAYVLQIKNYGGNIGIVGYRSFDIYDTNANQLYHYSDQWNPISGVKIDLRDFCIDNNNSLWLAHYNHGLIHVADYTTAGTSKTEIIYPVGPLSNDVYNLTFDPDGKLYLAPGGKDNTGVNKGIRADSYMYNGYYWTVLDYGQTKDSIYDALKVAIDPKNKDHVMISTWWSGIMEVMNEKVINLFDSTNTDSRLASHLYNYRIAGIDYDNSGNLFIASSLVPYGFVYRTFKNEWGSFYTYPYIGNDEIVGMTLDKFNSYKLIYTVSNKILLINNQGEMKLIDPNNGSLLETSNIRCMTQDKDGEIWIGTEKGIKVIYSLYGAFDVGSSGYDVQCSNIVYSEDGIAQYLLSFEDVKCIMVDGANRKWIGTERSGVYVLSPNGDKELYHFTLENSPLFSNKIICMAQNPLTGEVFIGTDRGLISYRAETLTPETEDRDLSVFPNPVRPDYNGLIAINGFVENSDVKITDANGRLVAHLQSLGGQAVWDGRNFEGQKVSSGVYFVFSSANEGENKAKGKFMIIR
ncbi:MAG: hypothetical protein IJ681_09740 [Bacteroidales bacterium]|nr:hypothetical protein [Bacteroidales bacterium]